MAKIIGEPLKPYVQEQITQRQLAHGSGTDGTSRTLEQLSYLNSKTAWVKLASSVRVEPSRIATEKIRDGFSYDSLAKHHILFGGISELSINDPILNPRGTYDGSNVSNIWNNTWGTYNVNARTTTESEFGLAPMPGITSVEVKCLNRGSIKRATVNLKCYTPEQFQIIDLLYLRIGYTMFLEWGNSIYLNNNGGLTTMRYTLTESKEYGFFEDKMKKDSYLSFLPFIEGFRKMNKGNYDGLLCKVVNFNWTFSQDGSYDINLELISLGDVVESLKLNLTPSRDVSNFINQTYSLYKDDEDKELSIPPSPAEDWISSYLFLQKIYIDDENNSQTGYTAGERQNSDNGKGAVAGKIGDDTFLNLGGVFAIPPTGSITINDGVTTESPGFETIEECKQWIANQNITPSPTEVSSQEEQIFSKTNTYYIEGVLSDINNGLFNDYVVHLKTFPSLEVVINADDDKKHKDVVYFSYNWGEDDEDQMIEDKGFYMRFGHLLSFIQDYVVPVIKDTSPLVKIDYNMWLTKMYTLPFQVSLDPRVCIVNASTEPVNSKQFFPNLINWKYVSDDLMKAYGLTMNIYINHSQILSSLEESKNEKGDANLFDFLNSLCTAINKAMGGINNLEPIYDEDTHTIYIIDGSYAPKNPSKYEIDLYGYNPEKKSSNFIRGFNLKTEITNEFATMATIGSTAGGYTKGVENTMFSKWNKGLQDPWKEKISPPPKSVSTNGDDKSISQMYYEDFWMARYSAWGYTLKDVEYDLLTSDKASLSDELIEKNLTLVTEFYKYCQSVIQSKQAEYSSPTNGFVPISLGLTMDGISGIKIYNEINVNTKFLPKNYSDSLRFIVKGVNHKLSDSDWETNIETVVISNSGDSNQYQFPYWRIRQIIKEIILDGKTESQESSLPTATAPTRGGSGAATAAVSSTPTSISDCSQIPSINIGSKFGVVKSSTTDYVELIKIVIENQEGTYYHPTHAINYKTNKIKKGYKFMRFSGETLWGIDRYAGQQEKSAEGRYFWSEVDKISGYGWYGKNNFSKNYNTKLWANYRKTSGKTGDFIKSPNAWGYNTTNASPSNLPTLFTYATKNFLIPRIKSSLDTFFSQNTSPNASTVKNLVLNDGRLLYMYIRSWYSGVGNMQKDVNSIIRIYDSGVRDIEQLACKELSARWNRRKNNDVAHKSHQQIKALIGLK